MSVLQLVPKTHTKSSPVDVEAAENLIWTLKDLITKLENNEIDGVYLFYEHGDAFKSFVLCPKVSTLAMAQADAAVRFKDIWE